MRRLHGKTATRAIWHQMYSFFRAHPRPQRGCARSSQSNHVTARRESRTRPKCTQPMADGHTAPRRLHVDRIPAHAGQYHRSPRHPHAHRVHTACIWPKWRPAHLRFGRRHLDCASHTPRARSGHRQRLERWSVDELMSNSAVSLRFGSTATRSSNRDAFARLSVELTSLLTSCCCGARPYGTLFQQLAEASADKFE